MSRSKKIKFDIRKVLTIIFCAGILLCGIGAGVGFIEYSSFKYLGKKDIGGDEVKTKTVTENLYRKENKNVKIYVHSYGVPEQDTSLEFSKDVPKDKIRFIVDYNPNNVEDISVNQDVETGEEYYGGYYDGYETEYAQMDTKSNVAETGTDEKIPEEIYVTYYVNAAMIQDNGLDVLFTYKDEILDNIKHKRFYEYNYPTIKSLKVLVHPSNKDLVSLY